VHLLEGAYHPPCRPSLNQQTLIRTPCAHDGIYLMGTLVTPCVIAYSGLADNRAYWGVMPHPQISGSSPG
jgi:hypothetical protein